MTDYLIEKLDTRYHDRDHFDCGIEILNVYLKNRANQEQKKHLNITYVAVSARSETETKKIIGYFTLSNSSIQQVFLPSELLRGIPGTYNIPAVKIGRLAIDKTYQNQGLGRFLLKNALQKISEFALLTGIKGVEVMAKNEDALNFYKKFGFIQLNLAQHLLFLPIESILAAYE